MVPDHENLGSRGQVRSTKRLKPGRVPLTHVNVDEHREVPQEQPQEQPLPASPPKKKAKGGDEWDHGYAKDRSAGPSRFVLDDSGVGVEVEDNPGWLRPHDDEVTPAVVPDPIFPRFDTLEAELVYMRKMFENFRFENITLRTRIEVLVLDNDTFKQKYEELVAEKSLLQETLDGYKKIFNPDSLSLLSGRVKRVKVWSEKSKVEHSEIRFMVGNNGYKFLREKGFPFCSQDVLDGALKTLEIRPGLNKDCFSLLGFQAQARGLKDANMTLEEAKEKGVDLVQLALKCPNNEKVLVIDEAGCTPRVEYDATFKTISGYTTIPQKNEQYDEESNGKLILHIIFVVIVIMLFSLPWKV